MKNIFGVFVAVPLMVAFCLPAFAQVCTKRALAIKKDVPEFKFDCGTEIRPIEWPETRHKEEAWSRAVSNYERTLEKWATDEWWNVPVAELNACKTLGKEGKITPDDKQDHDLQAWYLQGDGEIRVVSIIDPCMGAGTATFPIDSFAIAKRGKDVFAKMVVDGYRSANEYQPVTVKILKGENPVIKLSLFSGGYNPVTTFNKYKVNWISKSITPFDKK